MKINLVPISDNTSDCGDLPVDADVFAPGSFSMDQTRGPMILVPGSLCVAWEFGRAMVSIVPRERPFWTPAPPGFSNPRTYLQVSFHLAPNPAFYECDYRPPLGTTGVESRPIAAGDRVQFCPQLLQFTEAQHLALPRNWEAGTYYDATGWARLYRKWGLEKDRAYRVEWSYPEGFVKLNEVDILMATEVFQRI